MSRKKIKKPTKLLKSLENLKEKAENMIQYLNSFNNIENLEKLLGRTLTEKEKRYINNMVKKSVEEVLHGPNDG